MIKVWVNSVATEKPLEHESATLIDVRDDGHLYVYQGNKVLAIYAPSKWVRTQHVGT